VSDPIDYTALEARLGIANRGGIDLLPYEDPAAGQPLREFQGVKNHTCIVKRFCGAPAAYDVAHTLKIGQLSPG